MGLTNHLPRSKSRAHPGHIDLDRRDAIPKSHSTVRVRTNTSPPSIPISELFTWISFCGINLSSLREIASQLPHNYEELRVGGVSWGWWVIGKHLDVDLSWETWGCLSGWCLLEFWCEISSVLSRGGDSRIGFKNSTCVLYEVRTVQNASGPVSLDRPDRFGLFLFWWK